MVAEGRTAEGFWRLTGASPGPSQDEGWKAMTLHLSAMLFFPISPEYLKERIRKVDATEPA